MNDSGMGKSGGGAANRIRGKAKEMIGKVTGDERQKGAGKADQAKGKSQDAAKDMKEKAKGVADALRERRGGKGNPPR